MKSTPAVKVGQWVKRGDLIGYIGSSGASSGPHLHYEVMKFKPSSWRQYTKGLNFRQVSERYTDPAPFIKNDIPAPNSFPLAGYTFMQYVRSGNYWHPGIDLNGVADLGKPIYSPVEGRVQCVEDVGWLKNTIGKFFKSDYNGGWGRHVWIEQSPNFKL